MPVDPLDELEAILRQERAAILSGAWPGLAAIGRRKAACLVRIDAALGAAGTSELGADGPGRLRALGEGLGRNQALLLASLDGLRDAASRGAILRAARAGFSTYDAKGDRAAVVAARPQVERRA